MKRPAVILRPGLVVLLPSGNTVKLIRRVGHEWEAEYTAWARSRGVVIFSEAWLQREGRYPSH